MITWQQQLKIITSVFDTFNSKSEKPLDSILLNNNIKKDKIFMSEDKYSSYVLSEFKLLVIYVMFLKRPSSRVHFLQILSKLSKKEIVSLMQIHTDLLSKDFIVNKDMNTLETLSIDAYEAYKLKKIHLFGLYESYKKEPFEIKGRIMKKDMENILSFMGYISK